MVKKRAKTKALVLFSGGLDSRLVVKLLQEQGIEVEALYFKLPFGCSCMNNSDFSNEHGFKLTVLDCTEEPLFRDYISILKHPKFGRGSSMNPCIDCKIFMFRKAKEYADKKDISLIATGEVLGERPMSQTASAIRRIDCEIGFELLRPLSAQLLPETEAEKKKLVERDKFLRINGRSRKKQLELAKKFKIKFPNPAGGCLLCEKHYKNRLKDLFQHEDDKTITPEKLSLLSNFRHFRAKGKIILGRNEKENNLLEVLHKKTGYNLLIPREPGPTAIFEKKEDTELVKKIMKAYSGKNLEERKKFDKIRL